MDIINFLCSRRSIRKYTKKSIPEDEVLKVLKAAMYAPSARNQRPWHFIVVHNRETLSKITEIHPYANMLNNAQLAVIVCADLNLEQSEGYWVQDCAAATQNILLAIHGLGMGGVWLGVHPRAERSNGIRKIFNLPEHIMPFSMVSVGFPDEEKQMPDRFDIKRIHLEKW